MAFGIDVKGLKDQFKASFEEMMGLLREIRDLLTQIRDQRGTQ